MKNDHQENGLLRGPLILMVPASNLVAVMSLDWLDETDRAAVSAKTHGRKYLATLPRTPKDFGEPAGESLCHFPLNMMRIIRVLREDQDEHSASLKTLHDSFGPIGSRFDITGSDPTVDPSGLEMSTNRVRGRLIFTRMADEDHRRLVLRGIRVLVDLASYCLHKIACDRQHHERKDRVDPSDDVGEEDNPVG